jgi:hypothetical protein
VSSTVPASRQELLSAAYAYLPYRGKQSRHDKQIETYLSRSSREVEIDIGRGI